MNPTTALRPLSKITTEVLQNSRRLFSYKFEMTPRFAHESTAAAPAEEAAPAAAEEPPAANFRYHVCQPRTSPVERPSTVGDVLAAQKRTVQDAIEQQNLQPSMLPEYYHRKMERSPLITTEPEPNEGDRINNAHAVMQRRFQVSKTYANAILPLKSVKLANPFPEPVKMMMSRTVSDEEKAQQMLAEARTQRAWERAHSARNDLGTASTKTTTTTTTKRWFSSTVSADPDKCKKMGKVVKKGTCPKMRLAKCPPPARVKCERIAREIHCKKQEAPYPAYSEFCHEDPDEKPSECKMCPWTPEENPNFKPKKKSFHTSAALALRRSGLEQEEVVEAAAETAVEPPPPEDEGMLCDLRKPECERPKNTRCPPKPAKDEKADKDKAKKKEKSKDTPKKKKALTFGNGLADILEEDRPRSVLFLKDGGKGGGCKVRKFKFPECGQVQKRPKIERQKGDCPVKKRKMPFRDCPPDKENSNCRASAVEDVGQDKEDAMLLEEKVEKDKRKCPKVDLTINKPPEAEDDDPCNLKRKGTTKICPGDLLKKKRRKPRKKTSGLITPPPTESTKKDHHQPQPVVRC